MNRTKQITMFTSGQDTPLFSGTPQRVTLDIFTEREPEPKQLELPTKRPTRMVHIDTINGRQHILFGIGLTFHAYHKPTPASLARVTKLIDAAPERRTDTQKYSNCYLGIYPAKG